MNWVVALAGIGIVASEDPIVTDRPDFTESGLVVGKGRTQVESGLTFERFRPDRQFDIHYGIGLTRNAPDFFIGAGYSIRF